MISMLSILVRAFRTSTAASCAWSRIAWFVVVGGILTLMYGRLLLLLLLGALCWLLLLILLLQNVSQITRHIRKRCHTC